MLKNEFLENVPVELQALNQWCLAARNGAPLTVVSGDVVSASVIQPSTWMPFRVALEWARKKDLLIGFVLSENDPYSCIDLDVKDIQNAPDKPETWTSQEQYDLFYRIVQSMDSYTEASRSGKGLHIWIVGDIGKGVKRDSIEIYSKERFIICTGKIVVKKAIVDRDLMLNNMASQMRPVNKIGEELVEAEEDVDDWNILKTAVSASNSDKFCKLWLGEWKDLKFPSQSEADLALMSMFTFYSKSNAQCRRLFRDSALGKRDKAVKDDRYIDLTLKGLRSRIARENAADISAMVQAANTVADIKAVVASEVARLQGGLPALGVPQSRVVQPLHIPGQVIPSASVAVPVEVAVSMAGPMDAGFVQDGKWGMEWPPGFAGMIAQFIYQSAPRPVKEVAVVATLGLLAGICGKAWCIPQSGLNMYIVLVARSAIGKEAMHSGISSLVKACSVKMPSFGGFVDFNDYASGPALIKACAANPSFVNVSGEWGRKLRRLSADDRDGPLATFRTQLTSLYQKSGPQAIVGGIGYSNQDKNIASVAGVSYSMIGETTPNTFYESLTENMMDDGFMSRFLVVEYHGDRPAMNKNQVTTPDAVLEDALIKLAFQAQNLINMRASHPLARDEKAAALMAEFEQECDEEINATDDESRRQMWNRGALKVLRIAALLAVADNWMNPIINKMHTSWALNIVKRDIMIMSRRITSGDVGSGDCAREKKLVMILKDYLTIPLKDSYRVPDKMRLNSIVPRSFLQIRISNVSSFYTHKMGENNALDFALQTMVANGYLMEVDRAKTAEAYNFHGKSYRILKLPEYESDEKVGKRRKR